MFSTQAIVLKKTEIRNGEFLYTLLTRDFGRIRAWSNKRKKIDPVDHGTVISCMISTKHDKNSIESARVVRTIRPDTIGYRSIVNILSCLRHVGTFLPEGMQYPTVFDDYIHSIPFFEREESNERSTVFFTLKLLKSCGVIAETIETVDPATKKIIRHIERYPIRTFHAIGGVADETVREIARHNERHILPYLS